MRVPGLIEICIWQQLKEYETTPTRPWNNSYEDDSGDGVELT